MKPEEIGQHIEFYLMEKYKWMTREGFDDVEFERLKSLRNAYSWRFVTIEPGGVTPFSQQNVIREVEVILEFVAIPGRGIHRLWSAFCPEAGRMAYWFELSKVQERS